MIDQLVAAVSALLNVAECPVNGKVLLPLAECAEQHLGHDSFCDQQFILAWGQRFRCVFCYGMKSQTIFLFYSLFLPSSISKMNFVVYGAPRPDKPYAGFQDVHTAWRGPELGLSVKQTGLQPARIWVLQSLSYCCSVWIRGRKKHFSAFAETNAPLKKVPLFFWQIRIFFKIFLVCVAEFKC